MSKIWILHNSKYGNSEKVSQDIAEKLKVKYDVSVGSIKNITPEEIAKDNPKGVILGARILAFSADRKIRKFIEKIGVLMENNIPKIAVFYTHALNWKERFTKAMNETLETSSYINMFCPDYLEMKVEKNKGPIESGQEAKLEDFITKVSDFIG